MPLLSTSSLSELLELELVVGFGTGLCTFKFFVSAFVSLLLVLLLWILEELMELLPLLS